MLQVTNLCKSFGDSLVFDKVCFSVVSGEKLAVLGLNGAGKSTLIRILMDKIQYDSGTIEFGRGSRIGWMPQTVDELDLPNDINVKTFLSNARPLTEIQNKIAEIYTNMTDDGLDDSQMAELEKLENEFDYWGGYSAESELEKLIFEMGISDDVLDKNLGELSGGQKSKISFIRTLYAKPDILFLDEPTNHLDVETATWMTEYLKSIPATVIFISHDEDFVRALSKKVLYIDAMTKRANLYGFGYDRFLRTLAETNAALEKQMRNQMAKIEKVQKFIESAKAKSMTMTKLKRQAQSREKMLEKLKQDLVEVPTSSRGAVIDIKPNRMGDTNPIVSDSVFFAYENDRPVIKNLTFSLGSNERFIIIGENGAGKSTTLKLMARLLKPNRGIVQKGRKTDIGYYAQEFDTLDKHSTVLENVTESTDLETTKLRGILGRFNFDQNKVNQKISTLSPGERSRLELAKLCMRGANLLLLDEPTNHLDKQTKTAMAHALRDYGGTLVVVSHDTEFLTALGVDRMLMLPSGRINFYDENIVKRYMEKEKQSGAK